MSKRLPPTREQLLAMIAHSSWEKKVALCVIILLNRDPAQNEDTREKLLSRFCTRWVAC